MMEVMMKQLNAAPPPPSSVAPTLAPALDAPILAMMEKDPAARPPSVIDAVEAIVRAGGLHEGTTSPRLEPVSNPGRPLAPATAKSMFHNDTLVASSTASGTPVERQRRPLVGLAIAAVALLGAGLGVAAFALSGSGSPSRSTEQGVGEPPSSAPQDDLRADASGAATVSPVATVTPVVSASSPVVASDRVTLVVTTKPAEAELFDGDKRVGKGGEPFTLPRGTSKVRLTVTRPGFQPGTLEVMPDRDRDDLKVELLAPKASTKTEFGEF